MVGVVVVAGSVLAGTPGRSTDDWLAVVVESVEVMGMGAGETLLVSTFNFTTALRALTGPVETVLVEVAAAAAAMVVVVNI